jgi:hypothetical protein
VSKGIGVLIAIVEIKKIEFFVFIPALYAFEIIG